MVRLKRVFALNPMATIAELARAGLYASIEEFVANAYDADAQRVDLYYNSDNNTLRIQDNGEGMTPEELVKFYQVGGSPKEEEPISKKGRVRIGKFGVGTILLSSLCRSYTLVTHKDGIRTEIKEKFKGDLKEGEEVPYKTYDADENLHGTTIILRDLLFEEEDEVFELDVLRERLAWGFLPEDEFSIHLNNDLVLQKLDKYSEKFTFDIRGKVIGNVDLEIFYANASSPHAGCHIYVNSRRVGRPNDFITLGNIRQDFAKRLVVKIKANSLNDAINFNRDYFDTTHPAYVGLKKAVRKRLREVKELAESKERSGGASKMKRYIPKVRQAVEMALNDSDIVNMIKSKRGFILSFMDDEAGEVAGSLVPESGHLQINLEHPSIVVTSAIKPSVYEQKMLALCVDVIAASLTQSNNMNSYRRKCSEIWKCLMDEDIAPIEEIQGLLPAKLYTFSELANFTDFGYSTWRRLSETGVVSSDAHSRIRGSVVNDVIETHLNGYVSVYDVVARNDGDQLALDRFMRRIENIGEESYPFIVDFGDSDPCYFLYGLCADYVYSALKGQDYKEAIHSLKNDRYSFWQLSNTGDGMTTLTKDRINAIVGEARKAGRKIDEKHIRSAIRIKFIDFINECQIRGDL